jgi:hypothetical protein
VEFQVFNVTPLLDGMLAAVPRSSSATVLSETAPANSNTGVLVYGRTLEGCTVHVQLEMPSNFFVQIPREWASRHVKQLANALGACKFRVEERSRFVYYTPHLASNSNREAPQKLKYARLFFQRHAAAQSAYWRYSAEDGFRKGWQAGNADWMHLLEAASLPAVSDWHDLHVFSVHDLSDPVRDFFAEVDRKLNLSTDRETHASLESWLLLRPEVAWEPAKVFFARSSMNATIKVEDVVRVSNTLAAAPMTKVSFDIEQYSVLNPLTNTRPFPRFYRTTDEIRNICCAVKKGNGQIRTVALCMGATALPPSPEPAATDSGAGTGTGAAAGPANHARDHGAPRPGGALGDAEAVAEAMAEEAAATVVVQPGECRMVPGTAVELRVYAREDELLVAFGQLLADEECDLLTGYNIINYDEAAVFSRLYMYHLCKTMSYRELAGIHEVAKKKMDAFGALRAASPKLTKDVRDQIAELFALHASTYELTKDPPLVYVIFSQVLHFGEEAYAYFRDGPPVLSWFYHGKIPTRMVSYREHMYDTSAAGQFMMKQWQGTNSAILCAWVMLKRSQYRLSDYTLRGVLTYFFRGNAEYQKIDLDHESMHAHMESQDPGRLWEVAKYCCRDADAVLYLHDKLCTEGNMRQSGALLRTPIEVQADCGMQKLLLNMMFAELEGAYIINRFQRDVFAYEGAVVVEPITGFYGPVSPHAPAPTPARTHVPRPPASAACRLPASFAGTLRNLGCLGATYYILPCSTCSLVHCAPPATSLNVAAAAAAAGPRAARAGADDGLPVAVPEHHDRGQYLPEHDAAEAPRQEAAGGGQGRAHQDVGIGCGDGTGGHVCAERERVGGVRRGAQDACAAPGSAQGRAEGDEDRTGLRVHPAQLEAARHQSQLQLSVRAPPVPARRSFGVCTSAPGASKPCSTCARDGVAFVLAVVLALALVLAVVLALGLVQVRILRRQGGVLSADVDRGDGDVLGAAAHYGRDEAPDRGEGVPRDLRRH